MKASKEDLQFKFQNNNLQNENLLNEIARLNQTLNQKENGISDMLKKISELETKFEGELQKNNNLNIELNKKIGEISQLTEEVILS